MANDLDDAPPVRLRLEGKLVIYRSLASLSPSNDGPLRCPYCLADADMAMATSGEQTRIICPSRHTYRHPWIDADLVRWMLRAGSEDSANPTPAPTHPSMLFRPLDEVSPPETLPQLDDDDSNTGWWEAMAAVTGDDVPPLVQAMEWAAGLFNWALNHRPPDHYPADLDGDQTVREDEHMTVVLMGLSIFYVAQLENTQRIDEVLLVKIQVGVGQAARWLTDVQPRFTQRGGRVRQADRDRLTAALAEPGQARLRRWQDTAIAVVLANQAHGQAEAERDNPSTSSAEQVAAAAGVDGGLEALHERNSKVADWNEAVTLVRRKYSLVSELDSGWYTAITSETNSSGEADAGL